MTLTLDTLILKVSVGIAAHCDNMSVKFEDRVSAIYSVIAHFMPETF